MKVKTLIITAILALSMVAGTTGCAGSTETASGIATTASTTEESTTQAETVKQKYCNQRKAIYLSFFC